MLLFQTSQGQQIMVEMFRGDPGTTDPVFKVRHSNVEKAIWDLRDFHKLSLAYFHVYFLYVVNLHYFNAPFFSL